MALDFTRELRKIKKGALKHAKNELSGLEQVNGLSWNKIGGRTSGFFSAMDSDFTKTALSAKIKNREKQGMFVKFMDHEEKEIKNAVVEFEGKAVMTDEDGRIYVANEDLMDEIFEEEEELYNQYFELSKKCKTVKSLEILLNMSPAKVRALCEAGGIKEQLLIDLGVIDETNCLPEYMALYPKDSIEQNKAHAKLVAIMKIFKPLVKSVKKTNKKVESTANTAEAAAVDANM